MVKTIEAVFDGKVLRPEDPLALEPNTRVRITIEVVEPRTPRDAWERTLLAVARDCGVSLSHAALSREGLYE